MELTDAEKAKLARERAEKENERVQKMIADSVTEANKPMRDAVAEMAGSIKSLGETVAKMQTAPAANPKATNNMGEPPTGEREASVTGGESAAKGKGLHATRVIKASMVTAFANGGRVDPAEVSKILKAQGYEFEASAYEAALKKELAQGTFAAGGALVPQQFSTEVIELLRNVTTVRRMGARALPMGATLEIPNQASAGTAYYVGEGVAITPSQQALGSIRLAEKKLAALTVISNDLIRNAYLSAEQFVRDDLVAVIALKEDLQALFGTGGEYGPRGLTSLIDSANQYNSTAASQPAPTLAEIRKELAKAVRTLMENNMPFSRMGWIFAPRTWAYLWSITDGNGNSVYQAEMAQGRLLGYPFLVTNQIPITQTWSVDGSTDVSSIFFGDWNQFLIGESMGLQVEVFPNAAYDLSGTVVSGISKDQSVIRAMMKHDFNTRFTKSHVIVKTRMQ